MDGPACILCFVLYFGLCKEEIGNWKYFIPAVLGALRCAALAGLPNGVLSSGDRVRLHLISNIWEVQLPCCSRCPTVHVHAMSTHRPTNPPTHPSNSSTVAQASRTGTATMGTKQGQGAEPQTIDGTRLSSP
jgi:hypothetical protein